MPFESIGENLIIKDGVIVCKDGTDLKEYLAKFFKDGDEVNVVKHADLVAVNNLCYYTWCA